MIIVTVVNNNNNNNNNRELRRVAAPRKAARGHARESPLLGMQVSYVGGDLVLFVFKVLGLCGVTEALCAGAPPNKQNRQRSPQPNLNPLQRFVCLANFRDSLLD